MDSEKFKILILCSGNSCRSQMAEGFFRKYGNDLFEVYSAGLDPKPIHPMAIKTMLEAGVDISGQSSKSLRDYLGRESFRHVIFVCEAAEKSCPAIYPFGGNRISWPFEDPSMAEGTKEEVYAKFTEVRNLIEARIVKWLEETGHQMT